jgi:hypothetical protein
MKSRGSMVRIALVLACALPLLVSCGGSKSTSPAPVNHAPVISSVFVNPSSVATGGTVNVTVSASDPDGDALTYSYQAQLGAISGTGASVTWTAPSTAGTYQVTVTVSDGRGLTAQGNGTLTVTGGSSNSGTITGNVHLPAGLNGDLGNSRVALYLNFDDWNNDRIVMQTTVVGTGPSVSFTLNNVPPGVYYLDVWQDTNGDTFFDAGDWWGVNGTTQCPSPNFSPISVLAGQTSTATIIMISRP